ncbi:hypothetical protein [Mycolicibacterium pulveris]|uniref:hypothetical protein n=1 Tax=Mycolicibacterium pulveris TaxID=36813 RepID=UPI003CF52EC8
MGYCAVLKCNREATMPYAFWPVCAQHYNELDGGAEYRSQGSEQSATGVASPTLLMGESLRDLNEYTVVEPPTTLEHDMHYPEGALLRLRVKQVGGKETDMTLILPDKALTNLAALLSRHRPKPD